MGLETCLILGQVSLSLLYEKRNLPTDICGPREIDTTAGNIQARSFMARTLDEIGKKAHLKERQKWSNEKPKLDNAGRLRGIYFIDPEDKEFREPLRMLARNWKHQWLPLCFARQARRVSMGSPVVRPMISNQILRVSWKPVNPQDCAWKNLYQIITRTILQEKGTIHYNITIWYTNLFLCLEP